MASAGVELAGGRTTAGVVLIGDTVRRPPASNADFVHGVLRHLEGKGFQGAPRFLGPDDRGRDILSFLPGEVPSELGFFSEAQCTAAARLLRSLHDATMDCELRGRGEIVCHGDASPCNFVFVNGEPRGLIDFDAAHPGSREDDLGYAAWLWLDIGSDDHAPEEQGRRLAGFFSAYDSSVAWQPVESITRAMSRLAGKSTGPHGTREWARACLAWTRANRQGLQAPA